LIRLNVGFLPAFGGPFGSGRPATSSPLASHAVSFLSGSNDMPCPFSPA